MVAGHAFICSAVNQLRVGYKKCPILCGLTSRRQVCSSHPAPLESNGMRAMSETLDAHSIPRREPHLIRQAGGIRRGCMREKNCHHGKTQIKYSLCVYKRVLSTHIPPPSACMPNCSHECWLHYRCTGLSLGAPHWSVSEHHQPLCVSMVTVLVAWTS